MKTRFEERTYPGILARPSVRVHHLENENIYSLSVPWGTNQAVETLLENLKSSFMTYMNEEATQVGPPSTLQREVLAIKAVLSQTHTQLINTLNKDSYVTACETLVLHLGEKHLSWIQVGQPFVLLLREQQIQILQAGRDLSLDYSMTAPLPAELLGVQSTLEVQPQHLLVKSGDVVIFFNATHLPLTFQKVKTADKLFDSLARENKDLPFWLGLLSID